MQQLGNRLNKPTPTRQAINSIYNRKAAQKKQKSEAQVKDSKTKERAQSPSKSMVASELDSHHLMQSASTQANFTNSNYHSTNRKKLGQNTGNTLNLLQKRQDKESASKDPKQRRKENYINSIKKTYESVLPQRRVLTPSRSRSNKKQRSYSATRSQSHQRRLQPYPLRTSAEFKSPGKHQYPNTRTYPKTCKRSPKNVTTSQKREKAEQLMRQMDRSSSKAISESKKSFISLRENESDFSTVKGDKLGHTSALDYQPLHPIQQVESDTASATTTPNKSRFRQKNTISDKSFKRPKSKQRSKQLLDEELNYSQDYQQKPLKELAARQLRNVPRSQSMSQNLKVPSRTLLGSASRKKLISVSSVANSAKNKMIRKSLEKTFESMNDRVSFTIDPVPEKDDPYTETF